MLKKTRKIVKMNENYFRTVFIIYIAFLSVVQCSTIPRTPNSRKNNEHQRDNPVSLINNASVEKNNEEHLEKEYHDDYIDYYQSTQNLGENSDELVESWPEKLFGTLKGNETLLEEFRMDNFNDNNRDDLDIHIESTDDTDTYNKTSEISIENMSQDQKALLLQLRESLSLGSNSNNRNHESSMIPPQFMTHLYQVVTEQDSGITVWDNLHGASEVWSILETNPSVTGIFQFDLSRVNSDDIVEAELHVYRIGLDGPTSINHQPYYLLRVYQVMPTSKHPLSLNPDVHQLLNVHYESAFDTGWQVFRVTTAVEAWRNGTSPNLGLLITATTVLNEPVDVRFARKHQYGDKFQPSLILFTNNVANNKSIADYNERVVRSSARPQMDSVISQKSSHFTGKCSIKSLYIDFTKIGWSHFIISPMGFQAYQCSGQCKWPMTAGHNSTNHAIVRTILSNIGYDTTAACCVPTVLDPIIVLYRDDNDNFVLKTLENMVVRKCECQ